MIDTWLFAACCLIFFAFCAVLRVIPGPVRDDRIVSLTAAITLAAAAAPAFSLASGNLFILNSAIVIALLLFAGMIGIAGFRGGEER